MDAKRKVIVSFFVLIVVLGGMYFFTDWFSKTIGYFTGEPQKIRLMECMQEKGAVFYFSENCPHCQEQKRIIGKEALSYFGNMVDCDFDTYLCRELKGVPAWKINGNIYYGVRQIDELVEISGCLAE